MDSEAVCSKSDNWAPNSEQVTSAKQTTRAVPEEAIGYGSRLALASLEKPDEALPSSAIKNPLFTRATMLLNTIGE
jgi:hypothetical protein